MPSLVILHVSLGPEALSASLGAYEWPLVTVDEHVDAQVLLLRECLSTSGLGTLKRLSAIVQVEVGLQTDSTGEYFLAPLVRASQNQLLPVGVFVVALGLAQGEVIARLAFRGFRRVDLGDLGLLTH